MFTYSACGVWFGEDYISAFGQAANNGFKALENLLWTDKDLDAMRQAIDETGVELSAILFQSKNEQYQALISNDHGIVHEDAYEAFKESIRETLEAAKKLKCKNIVITTGNERFDVPRKVQHDNIVRALKAGAEIVKGSGVKLVLEPLNILVNHIGYYLSTTAETAEIIDEVASPDVLILYDVYHQQITEGNIINNIRKYIGKIGHIHVGDVPGRFEPGTGEINYRNVFKAIKETGYDGFVTFECNRSEDAETVSRKMFELLK